VAVMVQMRARKRSGASQARHMEGNLQ
jgi:hypothetical protein